MQWNIEIQGHQFSACPVWHWGGVYKSKTDTFNLWHAKWDISFKMGHIFLEFTAHSSTNVEHIYVVLHLLYSNIFPISILHSKVNLDVKWFSRCNRETIWHLVLDRLICFCWVKCYRKVSKRKSLWLFLISISQWTQGGIQTWNKENS